MSTNHVMLSSVFATELLKMLGIEAKYILEVSLSMRPDEVVYLQIRRALTTDDLRGFKQIIEGYRLCVEPHPVGNVPK